MSKKIAARLLTLGLSLGLPLALGSAAAQSPVEVQFWTWYLSPKFDNYIKSTISDFEKANPGIRVKWFDKQDSMVQDFVSSVNLGSAPDVVNLNIDETAKAAQNGFLKNVDGLTTVATLKATFYPQPLANFTLGGKTYAYPWYGWLNEGVLLYNPDLLKQAGVKAPRSMTELLGMAKTIKDKTGAYAWVPALKDPNSASFLGYFYSDGLPIYDASGKAAFNTAAHAALLQQYVTLFRGGYIPEDAVRKEAFQVATELYAQNKVAMIVGGPQALTRIKDSNPTLYAKTVVTGAPLGKAKVQTGGSMGLVIPTASKHPAEAAKLAAFFTSNASQIAFAKVVPVVPTTSAAQRDPLFKRASGGDPIANATSLVGASGRYINPGFKAPGNSDDLYKNLNDNIEAALLGKKTAQAALNDTVTYWNANMKK